MQQLLQCSSIRIGCNFQFRKRVFLYDVSIARDSWRNMMMAGVDNSLPMFYHQLNSQEEAQFGYDLNHNP